MLQLTESLWTGLGLAGSFSLLAFGFGLLYRSSGILNLAHGTIAMLAGFITVSLLASSDVPWMAIPVGLILGGLLGVAVYFASIRPLLSRGNLIIICSTIALTFVASGCAQLVWGTESLVLPPLIKGELHVPGGLLTMQQLCAVLLAVLAFAIAAPVLRWTRIGQGLRAVADDSVGAESVGINVHAMHVIAMSLGGAFAGLAAVLVLPTQGISVQSGTDFTLVAVAAAILGGLGSTWGPAVGGIAIGLIGGITLGYAPEWYQVAQFGALILVLAIRPTGIVGGTMSTAGSLGTGV